MKLGIVGLPQSGRSTFFSALTGARSDRETHGSSRTDPKIATIMVYDERVKFLSEMYRPGKTTYARVEYLLPSGNTGSGGPKPENEIWNQIRTCDALLHVVRNFRGLDGSIPNPESDFWKLEEEMILSDLIVAEKRLERISMDRKRGKKPEGEEFSLVRACRDILEKGHPIRMYAELAASPLLKGFTFISAKPMLVIVNNEDEDETLPEWDRLPRQVERMAVRARLEQDIASMSPEEAEEFLEAYQIQESALDRVIRRSFRLLNRVSFFTVGSDEVRAWPIPAGTPASKAAGTVHSDMEKGFIRAEILSFEDLKAHGSFQAAKKGGRVRLEGRDYEVQDGDIITFRFNI